MKANAHTIVWRDWTPKDIILYTLEGFFSSTNYFEDLKFLVEKNNKTSCLFKEFKQTNIDLTKLKLIEEIIEKWFLNSNFKKAELTELFISEIKSFSDTERDPNRKDVLVKRNYMKEILKENDLCLPAPLINSENKLLDGYNRMLLAKNINLDTIKVKKLTTKTKNNYLFNSPLLTTMIQNLRLKNTSFSVATCFQANYDIFDYFN